MNERTTLEIIAPTVEEAIAQGLAQLGLTADAVSVEVLDAGTKGFFGLGKTQVRVRLTVNPSPMGVIDVQTESASVSPRERERVESKPEPLDTAATSPAERSARPAVVSAPTQDKPQPEHDALLDRTESIISKIL